MLLDGEHKRKGEDACEVFYYITPDEEPELHMPQDEVQLEQAFLSESGQTEDSFAGNTSAWD